MGKTHASSLASQEATCLWLTGRHATRNEERLSLSTKGGVRADSIFHRTLGKESLFERITPLTHTHTHTYTHRGLNTVGANSQVPSGSLIWLQTPPSLGPEWMGHQGAGRPPRQKHQSSPAESLRIERICFTFYVSVNSSHRSREGRAIKLQGKVKYTCVWGAHVCTGVHRCAQVCTCVQVCIGVGMQLCMCKETERTWGSVKEV